MSWQERRVQVNDAAWIVIQKLSRDDLPEVCQERPIGAECFDPCDSSGVTTLGDVFDS
jgi:hypothetical protein